MLLAGEVIMLILLSFVFRLVIPPSVVRFLRMADDSCIEEAIYALLLLNFFVDICCYIPPPPLMFCN
jgi:hypothetical protein